MKLQIKKNKFEKHLNKLKKALSSNNALASLNGILFKVTSDEIESIASNGTFSIKETTKLNEDIKVIEPGIILIPGKMLINVIKTQNEDIYLDSNKNTLTIQSEKSIVHINLLNKDEYPNIDFNLLGEEMIVDADAFRESIKSISFASSENDKRIIINGINLVIKKNVLRMSATDSYRLATTKMSVISNNEFNITILTKNIKDFIPSYVSGEVRIQIDDNKINLKHEDTMIQSRLIDGLYPELSGLIPKNYNFTLRIKAKKMMELIDKSTVVSSGSETQTIKLSVKQDELNIESQNKDIGQSHISTNNFSWEGKENFEIVFDYKFFKDAVNTFNGDITIRFIERLKPFIITSTSKPQLIQLILPHRGY